MPPEVFRYSGLGCMFAAGVLLFTAGGWWLDRRLHLFPLFTLFGALVGTGLSTLSVWRRVQAGPGDGENSARRDGGAG